MGWSRRQFRQFQRRHPEAVPDRPVRPQVNPSVQLTLDAPKTAQQRHRALGRLPVGTMNKTERAYSDYLAMQQAAGEILWFKFEAVKLRLADNTFYSPDFAVMGKSGVLEMHEVKGFWEDDARVKIKVAAALYPFVFVAVKVQAKKRGGGWEREEF